MARPIISDENWFLIYKVFEIHDFYRTSMKRGLKISIFSANKKEMAKIIAILGKKIAKHGTAGCNKLLRNFTNNKKSTILEQFSMSLFWKWTSFGYLLG